MFHSHWAIRLCQISRKVFIGLYFYFSHSSCQNPFAVEELIDDGQLEDKEMNILYDKVIWLAGKKTKATNSDEARKTHQFQTFGGVKWDEYKSLCQKKLQQETLLPCKEEGNLKMEILSESPDIVRYLDVYSDDEVTFMESIAEDLFPGTKEVHSNLCPLYSKNNIILEQVHKQTDSFRNRFKNNSSNDGRDRIDKKENFKCGEFGSQSRDKYLKFWNRW